MSVQQEKFKEIADAIRAMDGSTGEIVANDFASRIRQIPVGVDTDDATATASDIITGKTAYVKGEKVTGNIVKRDSTSLTSNNLTVTVPAGYYGSQVSKTLSNSNLVANNIKSGVNIFGVTGTANTVSSVSVYIKNNNSNLDMLGDYTPLSGGIYQALVPKNTSSTFTISNPGYIRIPHINSTTPSISLTPSNSAATMDIQSYGNYMELIISPYSNCTYISVTIY